MVTRADPAIDESNCEVTMGAEADSTSTLERWMMARALSDDLRLRVLKLSAKGVSAR